MNDQQIDKPKTPLEIAQAVLENNDRVTHTIPAEGIYPHQWLWDSCFIAIGLRHISIERAKIELHSLLRGQWSDGMMPNIVLSADTRYRQDRDHWRSWISHHAPHDVVTSGITQPPMLAEAVVRVGQKLSKSDRLLWYKKMFPHILAYHRWLYKDRDPDNTGLVFLVHSWESGMDNTPSWVAPMHESYLPFWVRLVGKLKLDQITLRFRRDTKFVPAEQRMSTIDGLAFYSLQRKLRRLQYDSRKIRRSNCLLIRDVAFNCIFIRANFLLQQIAKDIHSDIPPKLLEHMKKSEAALENLWDETTGQYYCQNARTNELIKISTIGTLFPLYSGVISDERAERLLELAQDDRHFGAVHPLPTVDRQSEFFRPNCYWQGPSWVNTNWLLIDGLKRYKFKEAAEHVRRTTIAMIEKHGCYEYFSPISGQPLGVNNFSWTAALFIDLLHQ